MAALRAAYLRRWQAALVLCQGGEARLLHPPRRPPKDPTPWLAPVRGGGGTPLVPALRLAATLAEGHLRRHPHAHVELHVLTDGRAHLPTAPPPIPARIRLIDLQPGRARTGHARRLAERLGADYWSQTGPALTAD